MTRITISLEEELFEKIKELQEQMEKKGCGSWSISKTINLLILGGVLSEGRLHIVDWSLIKSFADGKKIVLKEKTLEEYVLHLLALQQYI